MDNVINFRKRTQRFEERAATATNLKPPDTGKEWLTPGTALQGGSKNTSADLGLGAGRWRDD
jgi:hypothetical protein